MRVEPPDHRRDGDLRGARERRVRVARDRDAARAHPPRLLQRCHGERGAAAGGERDDRVARETLAIAQRGPRTAQRRAASPPAITPWTRSRG
jgi:hypothetical protein